MHDVSIIGAGISGLSTAIALKKFSLKVRLFEKNNSFSNLGAGIQLGPNGTRAISSLGLLDEVMERSARPERLLVYDIESNKNLCGINLGLNTIKKYGFPYLTILRSDLHNLLEQIVVRDPNIEIIKGCEIKKIETLDDKVSIFNYDGEKYSSHALVASDGIHSNIRKIYFKNNQIGNNESTAYRTLIKNNSKTTKKYSKDIKLWFGNSFHVVSYPVGINNDINIVVVTKQRFDNNYGWSNPCNSSEFISYFADYPDSEITQLISGSLEWFKWPIFGCKPIKRINEITKNSIILFGDAAHYMKPHLAQGACMALEDSSQIFHFLKHKNTNVKIEWNLIFNSIAKKRLSRIIKVQKKSILNGHVFQLNGILRLLRNFFLRIFGRLILDQKWLYRNYL